jgi:type VI secretion system protein ImpK
MVAAVAAGILVLVYGGFLYSLNANSDPVMSQIAMLGRETADPEAPPQQNPTAPRATLRTLLASDIQEGLVSVEDEAGQSVVTLWGLFASGAAQVANDQVALLERVAQALNEFRGPVSVTGHTDNRPIRSLRFPSNWELSERRAEAVVRALGTILPPQRLRSEGRADSKPLESNDTPLGRTMNRRVEITLYPQGPEI